MIKDAIIKNNCKEIKAQPMLNQNGYFLVGQGGIIEHKPTGKILITHRSPKKDYAPGVWDYPSGRLHQYEHPYDGVKREIKEETGLEVEIVKPVRIMHFFRGEKKKENDLVFIAYWCITDSDKVKLCDEAIEYKWLNPEEALGLIKLPGVREDIKAYIKEKNKKDD